MSLMSLIVQCDMQELPSRTRHEEKIASLDAELFPGFVRSTSLAKQKSKNSRQTHSMAASRGLSHISQLSGSLGSLASNMSEKTKKSRFIPIKKKTAELKQSVSYFSDVLSLNFASLLTLLLQCLACRRKLLSKSHTSA